MKDIDRRISLQIRILLILSLIVLGVAIYLAVQMHLYQINMIEQFEQGMNEKRIEKYVRRAIRAETRKTTLARSRLAAEQAADFINVYMATTPKFENTFKLIEHSLESVDSDLDGHYAEFGVYNGKSINFIASKIDATVHGFDSFEGLPEDWTANYKKGHFKIEGLPEVADNVELHVGWFDKSVPNWSSEHPGPMKFIHFDADLYSSTKTVLEALRDRIVPGTIMQFDEFFNYPSWKQGEYKALMEFVDKMGVTYEYIGYVKNAQQVAIRIITTQN